MANCCICCKELIANSNNAKQHPQACDEHIDVFEQLKEAKAVRVTYGKQIVLGTVHMYSGNQPAVFLFKEKTVFGDDAVTYVTTVLDAAAKIEVVEDGAVVEEEDSDFRIEEADEDSLFYGLDVAAAVVAFYMSRKLISFFVKKVKKVKSDEKKNNDN